MITNAKKISSLFLAHGSPMLAIQDNEYTAFLATLGQRNPKFIIIFTAHWESEVTAISSIKGTYDMIYDCYGFPEALYQVKYPAKGSVELAEKIQQALQKNGVKSKLDTKRGLDHGSWSLLSKVFPKADVPVVQMSVNPFLAPKAQLEIGKALRDLDEEVLIIGSGVTVHNLRKLDRAKPKGEATKWAAEFDDWLVEQVKKKDYAALENYASKAPYANDAVPRPEHFVPLLITLGASDPSKEAKVLYRDYEVGNLSYLSFEFA